MKSSELVRMLENAGWYRIRQKGSHMTMAHQDSKKKITVPKHGSAEVGTGLARKILKDAGLI